MSAGEPPNPYAAPTAALSDGQTTTGAAPSARPRKPSRVGAILLSLLAYPLAGAGLYLLGRQRRFAFWVVSTVLLWATMITAVRTSAPKLAVIAMAATLLCALAALLFDYLHFNPVATQIAALAAVGCFAVTSFLLFDHLRKKRT